MSKYKTIKEDWTPTDYKNVTNFFRSNHPILNGYNHVNNEGGLHNIFRSLKNSSESVSFNHYLLREESINPTKS